MIFSLPAHRFTAVPPSDLRVILRRESTYCALGRLSRSVSSFGGLDFQSLLSSSSTWMRQGIPLSVLLSIRSLVRAKFGRHRILKRRLAWLIGQWITSDEECAKLPVVWQVLVHLLQERGEASDLAVSLTTAVSIKDCVDVSPSSCSREALI